MQNYHKTRAIIIAVPHTSLLPKLYILITNASALFLIFTPRHPKFGYPLHLFTMLLHQLIEGIAHLFYPHICEGCSKQLVTNEQILCISCASLLPETNNYKIPDNETGLRFAGRVPYRYAATYAYFTDDGLLQHLLHRLKYAGKQEIGTYLGKKFGQNLKDAAWINEIDAIIPVPLHPDKLAKRGFNQTMLLGQGMAQSIGIDMMTDVLIRTRNTESQTSKSRSERVENMAGAFRITQKQRIEGKHILLIDDVLTTGATLEACALALMEAKGVAISIATIGIAV